MSRTFEVLDPATLDVVAEVPDQGVAEARQAVDAATAAFPPGRGPRRGGGRRSCTARSS